MKKQFDLNSGLSLAEVMIGLGLLSGFVLMTTQYSDIVRKQLNITNTATDVIIDKSFAVKMINSELSASGPSFNFGKQPIAPPNQINDFWTMTATNKGSREIKLQSDGQCIEFISVDNGKYMDNGIMVRRKTLVASPSFFFKEKASSTDATTYDSDKILALLAANQLNNPNQVVKLSGMVPYLVGNDPDAFYSEYGILLIAPAKIDTTYATYPLPKLNSTCSNAKNSIEAFLRCLPSPGGGSSVVFITPVNHITYCLKRDIKEGGYRLIKKHNSIERILASRVDNFSVIRKDSTLPMTAIKLEFCKLTTTKLYCKPGG